MIWTPGGSKRFDPLFPGSALRPGSVHEVRGSDPLFPGTGPIAAADSGRFAVEAGPTAPIDWSVATLAAQQTTQGDYESTTIGMAVVDLYSLANDVAARVAALDNRSRDNFNYASSVLMANGNSTVDYTTTYAYASAPLVTPSFKGDTSAPGSGVVLGVSACAQNPNGTWTATITSNLAAPVAGWPIGLDIKGAVSAATDID